jgi:cell division protein FtsB
VRRGVALLAGRTIELMSVDLGIWEKLNRAVVFLLVVAGILGVVVWYLPVIKQNEKFRQEILRLNQEIRREEEKVRQSKAMIDALQHDRRTVERMAREGLGYARTNETVIRFGPPTNTIPAKR